MSVVPANAAQQDCTIQTVFSPLQSNLGNQGLSLGNSQAPVRIDVFFDPIDEESWPMLLKLRRLIVDANGEVFIYLRPTRPPLLPAEQQDIIRQWVIAVAKQGRMQEALRLLERDGYPRMMVRLQQTNQHEDLAKELDLTPQQLADALGDTCARQQLLANNQGFYRAQIDFRSHTSRLPALLIDPQTGLRDFENLQLHLQQAFIQRHRPPFSSPPIPPTRKPSQSAVMYPPGDRGVMLGDVGHPHRLVVVINPEARPQLDRLLPAFEFRSRVPDRLAIQILVRNPTPRITLLQKRFQAARALDLELEYVRMLTTDFARDPARLKELEQLERRLDAHPLPDASAEPANWPLGVWLDGEAVDVTKDLPQLDVYLEGLEASVDTFEQILTILPTREDIAVSE